jgi:hypothetical protein
MMLRLAPAACCLLFLAGCGPAKLNEARSLELGGESPARAIDLDAQSKPQKITVEFSSPEDVTVLLFKAEDAKTDDDIMTADPKKALGFKKGKEGSFVVDVPEKTATRVFARMETKKTTVQVKVKN